MLLSPTVWSQDAVLQRRILSIADKFINNIVSNVTIRKNIIPDTSTYAGIDQTINSRENYLAGKIVTKSLFYVPYNFLLGNDTIGTIEILVDTLSNSVQLQGTTTFEEHALEMIKGYSLAMDNKFTFSYSDAKKYALKNKIRRKPFLFVERQPVFLNNDSGYYIQIKYFWILTHDTEKESITIKLDTETGKVLEEDYRHKKEHLKMPL